jgi:pimeloyl-ACP methyl ester carboxylesterase
LDNGGYQKNQKVDQNYRLVAFDMRGYQRSSFYSPLSIDNSRKTYFA